MMEQCQPLCRLLLCKRFATAFRPFSPNKCEPEIPQLTFVRTFYFLHSEVQNLLSLFLFFTATFTWEFCHCISNGLRQS